MDLEALPIELKVAILRLSPDLSTLRALIRSSPLYHDAYISRRSYILAHILQNDLAPAARFDACAVYEASLISTAVTERKEAIEDWLLSYKKKRSEIPNLTSLLEDQLVAMTRFHFTTVSSTASRYCTTILEHHPVTGDIIPIVEPSHTEMARVQRACYRIELFCVLFPLHHGDSLSEVPEVPLFNYVEIFEKFLAIYFEWEIEEITSVSEYLICCYKDLLCHNFNANIQTAQEQTVISIHQEHNHKSTTLSVIADQSEDQIEACRSYGLAFHCKLVHLLSDEVRFNDLAYTFREDVMALETTLQDYEYSIKRDVPRRDDVEPCFDDDEEKGPNAAWGWAIAHRDGEHFLVYRFLRVWGFVMWDRERLDSWEVLRENPKDVNVLHWGMQVWWDYGDR